MPCLHTFCSECLENSIESHRQLQYKRGKPGPLPTDFPCPVCKEKTKIPENGLAGFKDDFRISRISELLGKSRDVVRARWDLPESESDEGACGNNAMAGESLHGIKRCEVCKFFSKESSASLYCVECTKYLCESCSDKHLKTPIAKGHKVVNSSEAIDTQTNCKQHASEILKYFCRTCKIPLCIACTFTDEHQDHDVVELVEESGTIKNELKEIITLCRNHIPNVKARMGEFDKLEAILNNKEKVAAKAILQRTLEEITRLRANQNKMEQDLENVCRAKYQDILGARQKLQAILTDIKEYCEFTETVANRGQDFQVNGTLISLLEQPKAEKQIYSQ